MTLHEITYQIEDLQLQAKQIGSLQEALYLAKFYEGMKEDQAETGFSIVTDMMRDFNARMKVAVNELFEIMRQYEKYS